MSKLHRLDAHENLGAVLQRMDPRALDFEAMLSAWVRLPNGFMVFLKSLLGPKLGSLDTRKGLIVIFPTAWYEYTSF